MGLDAYIQEIKEDGLIDWETSELWYARKVWPIQHWMQNNTDGGEYKGDPDLIYVTTKLINKLKIAYTQQVLLLMPGELHGLGGYELERLKELIKCCEVHLANSTRQIVYYSSY